jgi:hypothetical protein
MLAVLQVLADVLNLRKLGFEGVDPAEIGFRTPSQQICSNGASRARLASHLSSDISTRPRPKVGIPGHSRAATARGRGSSAVQLNATLDKNIACA